MREGVFGPGHWQHVLHHHRLAVHPSVEHGLTSQFLAASLRALRDDRPEIWVWSPMPTLTRGTWARSTKL